ncbi:3',5'-cyclic-nucleotide phosphodiesterase (PDEase) (3':5'-CNP) [Physocladia obscura]|uniref:3',5'-cyclic-nucleotide phosphodiesterase (PDEase) (3':5'-CNP) n=1 Tax=Physocladia obscura TaxID=109957 RepID=A0AAD5SXQ9_9FUNG|nr:3',5'-cyclic-nucleotide phosphodiesterase (PDEase) (3':5'-CNP) [Physocladia obscura]
MAVGRMARVFNVLREEKEKISELKGLMGTSQLPAGTLALGAEGIKQAINTFEQAKHADKDNEKLPPMRDGKAPPPSAPVFGTLSERGDVGKCGAERGGGRKGTGWRIICSKSGGVDRAAVGNNGGGDACGFDTAELDVAYTRGGGNVNTGTHVALAGGKVDAGDGGSVVAAALREASEEIGLPSEAVTPVAVFAPVISLHGLRVSPVCAVIDPTHPALNSLDKSYPDEISETRPHSLSKTAAFLDRLTMNKDEVDAIFTVPLLFFLQKDGYTAMSFENLDVPGSVWKAHSFKYVDEFGRQFTIWGLTAAVLVEFTKIALGTIILFYIEPIKSFIYYAGRNPEFPEIPFAQRPKRI